MIVTLVVAVSSLLVSTAVVLLRPIQQDNQALEQARNVIRMIGDSDPALTESDELLLRRFRELDARVVDFDSGQLLPGSEALDPDLKSTLNHLLENTAIPIAEDTARLGNRANRVMVYLVWDQEVRGSSPLIQTVYVDQLVSVPDYDLYIT